MLEGAPPEAEEADAASASDRIDVVAQTQRAFRIAGSAHFLGEEALEAFEHDDIHRVLSAVPGVYMREEDGYGLRPNIGLRGANSDRSSKVTLMEDGILLGPAPYSAPAAYYFPMTTRMAGVEIFKGPASIRYGPNTVGGAVNLLSRSPPRGLEGSLDGAFGSHRFGKLHGHVGGGGPRFAVLVEGVHLRTHGFKSIDGEGNTGFEKNELMLKARYGTREDRPVVHRLELKLGYADEISNETYLGLSDSDFEATPFRRYASSALDRMSWDRTAAQLAYHAEADNFDLRITAYRHDMSRSWRKLNRFRDGPPLDRILADPSGGQAAVFFAVLRGEADSEGPHDSLLLGTNARDFVSQGVAALGRVRLEWPLPQEIEAGVRLHHDRIDRRHTEDGYAMLHETLVRDRGETAVVAENRGSAHALAAHIQSELDLWGLLLTPGVRLEWISTRFTPRSPATDADGAPSPTVRSDVVVVPGIGAFYGLTPFLGALAGVHRGFSPVAPGQAERVRPESSVHYEAGLRLSLARTRAEAIGFFNDYRNLTGECSFAAGCEDARVGEQFNAGSVFVYGLEAALDHQEPLPLGFHLDAALVYTLTQSRFRSTFASDHPQFGAVERGDELAYVPRHQGMLRLAIGSARVEAQFAARAVGAMRDTAGQGPISDVEKIPAHALIDAMVRWFVGSRQEVYLKADNLTDAHYLVSRRPYGARPGAPRQLMLGYKHRFGP